MESEVAVNTQVEAGAEVEVGIDSLLSITQMGGVIS